MLFDVDADEDGHIMTRAAWRHAVSSGAYIPSDGCGYWGNSTHYSYDYDCFSPAPEAATHAHWFNR